VKRTNKLSFGKTLVGSRRNFCADLLSAGKATAVPASYIRGVETEDAS